MGLGLNVIVGLTFFLALQPALAACSHHHKKLRHGRLRNHAASAGIRAVRKLSPLSSLSDIANIAAEQNKIDGQYSMSSIKELDAREEDNSMQWRPDPAANQSQGFMSSRVPGELIDASKQSGGGNGELGKGASDDNTSREFKRAESINGDLGKNATAVNGDSTASLHARNVVVDDQENLIKAAELSIPVKSTKDEIAHMSLDQKLEKQKKESKSPQAN